MLRSTAAGLFCHLSLTLSLTMTLSGMMTLGLTSRSLAQTTSANLPPRSLLKLGANGNDVTELQGVLHLMGLYEGAIDGIFSQATFTAVTRFQQLAGLSPDGVVGAGTWGKLLPPAPGETPIAVMVPPAPTPAVTSTSASTAPNPTPAPATTDAEPILRKGAIGPAVSRLQRYLRARGIYQGMIDGGFGDATFASVQAAQRKAGLEADGVVGPATWDVIRAWDRR